MSNNPKLDMLRAMMAGKATPETQQLAVKTAVYSDATNIGKVDSQMIQEMAERMPIPDMSDIVIPNQALPPVGESDILSLLGGKRPAPQQQRQQQVQNQESDDRFGSQPFNIHEELKRRAAVKNQTPQYIQEAVKPKVKQAVQQEAPEGLEDVIEGIVYKVLAQIVNEAVKRKMGI